MICSDIDRLDAGRLPRRQDLVEEPTFGRGCIDAPYLYLQPCRSRRQARPVGSTLIVVCPGHVTPPLGRGHAQSPWCDLASEALFERRASERSDLTPPLDAVHGSRPNVLATSGRCRITVVQPASSARSIRLPLGRERIDPRAVELGGCFG